MSFHKIYEIACDGCLGMLCHGYSVKECNDIITQEGWETKGKKHYCNVCKQEFNKQIGEE